MESLGVLVPTTNSSRSRNQTLYGMKKHNVTRFEKENKGKHQELHKQETSQDYNITRLLRSFSLSYRNAPAIQHVRFVWF